ncbi:MAG: sugar-transfer associated ATP-grasp domain-containing protein [Balneolaceae bacterium]
MLKQFYSRIRKWENSVLGINERNSNLVYVHNRRENYKFADDKLLTKQILSKHGLSCTKTYAVVEKVGEIESIWQTVKHYESLVIKPAKGSGGGGIKVLKKRDGVWCEGRRPITELTIGTHMANILFGMFSFGDTDRVIIEELIIPHNAILNLYPKGVADIRIIVCDGKLVMGMLRLPTDESDGKANLHQGGLAVGLDLDTGTLKQAYTGEKYVRLHPDSKRMLEGFKVPNWMEIVELSRKTFAAFPLNYMGIDIVIDEEKGPLVLEVNVRPGLGIQLANKVGLREALKNLEK